MIGIFKKTISHRKVQVSTAPDDTPWHRGVERFPPTGIPSGRAGPVDLSRGGPAARR
jgi:hypothetical protein